MNFRLRTVKKGTKKRDVVVVSRNKPIAFFTSSLPSPLLKLPSSVTAWCGKEFFVNICIWGGGGW